MDGSREMSEVVKIDDLLLEANKALDEEALEKQAKEKAAEQGKEIVGKATLPDGLAFLEENAKKTSDDPTYDPSAAALATFGLFSARFWPLVDRLSSKQLRRLIKALVTGELENVEVNKKNPIEFEAYKLAHQLLQSKYLAILVAAFEDQEKRRVAHEEHLKKQAEQKVSESTELKTGENNG